MANYYDIWENCIRNWFNDLPMGILPMGIWTDPDKTPPLWNSLSPITYTKDYLPEPWWGNHDVNTPLHSVVINFNPGIGGDKQLKGNIPYRGSYARDIVASKHLPNTKNWHENKRALPILNALKNIEGLLPADFEPSINNHLSVELIPWHTEKADKAHGFFDYLQANIQNVYEYSICFAANESKRIENSRLKNVVILKLSGTNTRRLLDMLNKVGYTSAIGVQQTVPKTQSYCLEFSITSLPEVRFCSIWGSIARNNFPPKDDLEYILKNFI